MVSRVAPFVLPSLGVTLWTIWAPKEWFENCYFIVCLGHVKCKHAVDLLLALKIEVGCFYILPEKLICRIQITRHKYMFCILTDPDTRFQCSGHMRKDVQLETGCLSVYF